MNITILQDDNIQISGKLSTEVLINAGLAEELNSLNREEILDLIRVVKQFPNPNKESMERIYNSIPLDSSFDTKRSIGKLRKQIIEENKNRINGPYDLWISFILKRKSKCT